MDFSIVDIDDMTVSDDELSALLTEVYVEEGFTRASEAENLFAADAVRSRGSVILAVHAESKKLAGIIILVPSTSKACKLAKDGEVEIHLLAVKKQYRGHGIGKQLVAELVSRCRISGYTKIILWTQKSMLAAQSLYSKLGFIHGSSFNVNKREFYLYHRIL